MLSKRSPANGQSASSGLSRDGGRDEWSNDRVRTLLGLPSIEDEPGGVGARIVAPRSASVEDLPWEDTNERVLTAGQMPYQDAAVDGRRPMRAIGGAPYPHAHGHQRDVRRQPDAPSTDSVNGLVTHDASMTVPADRSASIDPELQRVASQTPLPAPFERDPRFPSTSQVRHAQSTASRQSNELRGVNRQGMPDANLELEGDGSPAAVWAPASTGSARLLADGLAMEKPQPLGNDEDLAERVERLHRAVHRLEGSVASQEARVRESGRSDRMDRPSPTRTVVVTEPGAPWNAPRAFWERRRIGSPFRNGR